MTDGPDGETIAALEAEARAKLAEAADLDRKVQNLITRELTDGRPRAGEIHELRQRIQVLKWEAQHSSARANRLRNPWS